MAGVGAEVGAGAGVRVSAGVGAGPARLTGASPLPGCGCWREGGWGALGSWEPWDGEVGSDGVWAGGVSGLWRGVWSGFCVGVDPCKTVHCSKLLTRFCCCFIQADCKR